jgi:UDP-N-acetylmuramate dehydrogenase
MATSLAHDLLSPALRSELRARIRGDVRFEEPLARFTSWRIGGPAEAFVEAADSDDVAEVQRFAAAHTLPKLIVGGGSNLLILDGGVRGLVLSMTRGLRSIEEDGDLVVAGAGCRIGRLLTYCTARGRAGLEFLADIPGTVGGVVAMNAGAMGGELRDVARHVDLVYADGTSERVDAARIPFVYRAGRLPQGSIVVRAALETRADAPRAVQTRVSDIRRKRRAAQPAGASAGSTFKNPPGDYAGRLIEAAGLKGRRIGGAEISTRHANFIVNLGGATAADVLELIRIAREEVLRRFQVQLELEVKVVGEP